MCLPTRAQGNGELQREVPSGSCLFCIIIKELLSEKTKVYHNNQNVFQVK